MKRKLLLLIILSLLFDYSFASTSISTKTEFSLKFYPEFLKFNFNPNYYLYYSYSEGNISAYLDIRDSGWKGGYLTLSKIGNVLDITFAKYYLTVEGTKALIETLWYNRYSNNGIQINLDLNFLKITSTYLFRTIESDILYDTGRFRIKTESNFNLFNFWLAYDANLLEKINTYVLGAEIIPLPLFSIFFEYGNTPQQWVVGGSFKPNSNISLFGYYRGDGGYSIEGSISNLLPNTVISGSYFSAPDANNYMYVKIAFPPLFLGTIDGLFGYFYTVRPNDIWYLRLSSKIGKASNTFRIYKGWSFGANWFDPSVPFTCEDIISITF